MFNVQKKIKWLYEEHKELIKLTKNERLLCKLLDKNGYIARDSNGKLFYYPVEPHKNDINWASECDMYATYINKLFPKCKFEFIKWEDEKPYSIVDLLQEDKYGK